MSVYLVTRDELSEYLDKPVLEGDQNDQLIQSVSLRAARWCNRGGWGGSEERTEYLDGGTRFLLMNYWPITSVSAIYDDIDHEWATEDLVDSDDYYISDNGVIWLEYTPTDWFKSIKVVYTGGYASASVIPADLKQAALIQIRVESLQRTSASFNAEGSGWLPEVASVLKYYKRSNPVG